LPMPELAPVTIATLLMGMLLCNGWAEDDKVL
jgi:hypothetical protein